MNLVKFINNSNYGRVKKVLACVPITGDDELD